MGWCNAHAADGGVSSCAFCGRLGGGGGGGAYFIWIGSGKTAAFLFPILSKLLTDGPTAPREDTSGRGIGRRRKAMPEALILAPTRELAVQIFDEARKVRAGCLCCARDEARRPWLTLAWFLGM